MLRFGSLKTRIFVLTTVPLCLLLAALFVVAHRTASQTIQNNVLYAARNRPQRPDHLVCVRVARRIVVRDYHDPPTLDELRAQIAGMVVSPAQGIVNVLYQATGGVVNVLQAYLDKNDEGGDE